MSLIIRKPLESLNAYLKRLRESKGISQNDWAKAAGVDQPQVSRWEKGKGEPGVDNLQGIAGLLGSSVAVLIGDKPPEFAPPRDPSPEEMALYILDALNLPEAKLSAIRAILSATPGEMTCITTACSIVHDRLATLKQDKLAR